MSVMNQGRRLSRTNPVVSMQGFCFGLYSSFARLGLCNLPGTTQTHGSGPEPNQANPQQRSFLDPRHLCASLLFRPRPPDGPWMSTAPTDAACCAPRASRAATGPPLCCWSSMSLGPRDMSGTHECNPTVVFPSVFWFGFWVR